MELLKQAYAFIWEYLSFSIYQFNMDKSQNISGTYWSLSVTPNPATFSYDQNVGYYVDPETKFYFDQKTGYYFNNDTRKWCTWDATYSTYFPIEDTSTVCGGYSSSHVQFLWATSLQAEKTSNAGATNGPAEQTAEEKKSEEKAEEAKVRGQFRFHFHMRSL